MAQMTKQHFIAIANAINDCMEWQSSPEGKEHQRACVEIARRIADVCAASNLRFDRERFLKACGVQS